ncbi:MAG: hypothetical protein DWI09_00985 [Planctomycetota bacterium]|jgi:hypothetical protein|nr:MAG: hypothetical protein DWI09_00985 [Planctomycetota bacterium]
MLWQVSVAQQIACKRHHDRHDRHDRHDSKFGQSSRIQSSFFSGTVPQKTARIKRLSLLAQAQRKLNARTRRHSMGDTQ